MSTSYCDCCKSAYCYDIETCPECHGTGIFIGAGIEDISEPHYYNLKHPCKLPCRICNGEGRIIVFCPYYPT